MSRQYSNQSYLKLKNVFQGFEFYSGIIESDGFKNVYYQHENIHFDSYFSLNLFIAHSQQFVSLQL